MPHFGWRSVTAGMGRRNIGGSVVSASRGFAPFARSTTEED
jgi:hypothetical protein